MQRKSYAARLLTWPDKTMSMLQQRQIEACEERVNGLPDISLFSDCTDSDAEQLWQLSFDHEETGSIKTLHHVESLKTRVLGRMPTEALMLPLQEFDLMGHLLSSGGTMELTDFSALAPAESLVRRLWCSLRFSDDDIPILSCPPEVVMQFMLSTFRQDFVDSRRRVVLFFLTVMSALNTHGMLFADDVLDLLSREILSPDLPDGTEMAQRMLRTAFDYLYDHQGRQIILHPGMADPEAALPYMQTVDLQDFLVTDPEAFLPQALLSDAERNAALSLSGLIENALRPDLSAPMAVEDLRILAKQQVSFESMKEVLASQLVILPTESMLDALHLLYEQTPAWLCMPRRILH